MTTDQKLQIAQLAIKVAKVHGQKLHSFETFLLPGGPGVSLQVRFQDPPPPPPPKMGKGSIVRLKSGGPRMTVKAIRADKAVVCDWFDTEGVHSGIFAPLTLEVVS